MRRKIQKVKDRAQASLEKHFYPPDPGFRRRAHALQCIRWTRQETNLQYGTTPDLDILD